MEDLKKIQSTRKLFAENIDSSMLKDITEGTVIRFSVQNGKYIVGFVLDVVKMDQNSKS